MEHRIVWVHGIGRHKHGYSDPWREQFNRYLTLSRDHYIEVVWDSVFHAEDAARRGASGAVTTLTPQEALAEQEVREEVATILGARKTALEPFEPQGAPRGEREGPLEWSDLPEIAGARGVGTAGARGVGTWLVNPDEYLGDFAKYLVSRSVRNAVKEELKRSLRDLASGADRISIISHSWGTVVAYDSLLDLSVELPALKVANLFTLGSPLWLVRRLLEDRTGQKPLNVGNFVNVHARRDFVGSWLKPAFRVDKDYQVSTMGSAPHGSYFAAGNEQVQRNIVAADILRVVG